MLTAKQRAYYKRNKEKLRNKHREYYEKNKEVLTSKQRSYYEKNKERLGNKHREYYEKNKEKLRNKYREYYEKNKEKIMARRMKYTKQSKKRCRRCGRILRTRISKISGFCVVCSPPEVWGIVGNAREPKILICKWKEAIETKKVVMCNV